MNKNRTDIDSYYCVFLAEHPNGAKKAMNSVDSDRNGISILVILKLTKFFMVIVISFVQINFKTKINLFNGQIWFHYAQIGPNISLVFLNLTRQKVPADCWKQLYEEFIRYGMIPPTFGKKSSQLPPIQYDGCKKRKLDKIC